MDTNNHRSMPGKGADVDTKIKIFSEIASEILGQSLSTQKAKWLVAVIAVLNLVDPKAIKSLSKSKLLELTRKMTLPPV